MISAHNEHNFTSLGGPIVLQRRGSVYGANVPMITGNIISTVADANSLVEISLHG